MAGAVLPQYATEVVDSMLQVFRTEYATALAGGNGEATRGGHDGVRVAPSSPSVKTTPAPSLRVDAPSAMAAAAVAMGAAASSELAAAAAASKRRNELRRQRRLLQRAGRERGGGHAATSSITPPATTTTTTTAIAGNDNDARATTTDAALFAQASTLLEQFVDDDVGHKQFVVQVGCVAVLGKVRTA